MVELEHEKHLLPTVVLIKVLVLPSLFHTLMNFLLPISPPVISIAEAIQKECNLNNYE
jgi:hypothetical protein